MQYDGLVIDEGLRIDILVDGLVVVELKAQEYYHPVLYESAGTELFKTKWKAFRLYIKFYCAANEKRN